MSNDKTTLNKTRTGESTNLRLELDRLEAMINELKKQYEQFFLGILPLAPEKEHAEVKRKIRELLKAPFKNQAISFRLRTLETRYSTFHTYWQRTLKQREDGTYHRDVFKANLREKQALQESRQETAVGKIEKSVHALFESYKEALEKNSGKEQHLDYKAFQKSLVERAKELKSRNPGKKVSFKVVMKNGKVKLQANVKE